VLRRDWSAAVSPGLGSVFVDTGALYALWDRADRLHTVAVQIQQGLVGARVPAFTTWFVAAETHALILHRLGHAPARRWPAGLALPCAGVQDRDVVGARARGPRPRRKPWR